MSRAYSCLIRIPRRPPGWSLEKLRRTRHPQRVALPPCQPGSAWHSALRDFLPSRVAACLVHWQTLQLSYLKQETVCDALRLTGAGSRSLHTCILSVHLGSKGQPPVGNDEREKSPSITGSSVLRPFPRLSEPAGMASNRTLVEGG